MTFSSHWRKRNILHVLDSYNLTHNLVSFIMKTCQEPLLVIVEQICLFIAEQNNLEMTEKHMNFDSWIGKLLT
ncbi:hypothetical protein VNO78_07425 [Psophocarpus tetragonolobus]|uniref:Uncharacterized protein n=1 Tax=Psophocarpus tetragonolobus TaxID=3891 RepID=A0AAN9SW54_PSOTE